MDPLAEAPIRVLHVDDDPGFLELAVTSLARESDRFETLPAASVAEGLDVLAGANVDCVVSDYRMPETDGLEFLEAVRETHPSLPFVLFTGQGSEEIAGEAIAAGVTDYLQKGTGTDQFTLLANRIENAVGQYRAEGEVDRTQRRFQQLIRASSDLITVVDRSGVLKYVSPSAGRIVRHDPVDLLGEPVLDYLHPEDRPEAEARFRAVVEGGADDEPLTYRFARPDGSWVWLEARHRDLLDDPLIEGVVVCARDLSDYYEECARYRALVEHSRDVLTVLGNDGTIKYENPAIEDVLGYTPEELVGRNAFDLVHPDDRERAFGTMVETVQADDRTTGTTTYRIEHKDGSWVWVESVGHADQPASLDGYVVSSRDVTEHQTQEDRLATVIDRVTDAIVEVDAEWRFTLVNDRAESLYDVAEEDLLGREFWDVFEAVVGTRFEEEYRRVMATREPASFVEYYAGLDGWFDVTAYPKDDGGIAFYCTDVTDRREREAELQRQVDRYEAFEAAFPDVAFVVDADARYLEVIASEHSEELLYAEREALIGRTAEEVIPGARGEELGSIVRRVIDTGEPFQHEYSLDLPGGERWFEARVESLPFEYDGEEAAIWVARDVTERVEREREIERQRALLEGQQESVLDGMLVVNDAGEIVSYNDRFVELWGVPESILAGGEEAAGLEWVRDKLAVPEAFLEKVEHLYDHPEETSRDEIELADGRVFDRYTAPLVGDDGTYFGRLWSFRDITERIQREDELQRQKDRLEEFASIVSHDLRNPLTVVVGSIDLAEENGEAVHFERARRAADRMNRLIEDLLTLAREGETVADQEPVSLGSLVEECWQTIERADAVLRLETDRVIRADRSRLQQVLENLLRNAVRHAGADATIEVGALADGFYVEDDGPGIPEDRREAVFEAGFSTDAEGTGFGLRIVKQVADAHGWTVRVVDGVEGGARFEISGVEAADDLEPDSAPDASVGG